MTHAQFIIIAGLIVMYGSRNDSMNTRSDKIVGSFLGLGLAIAGIILYAFDFFL